MTKSVHYVDPKRKLVDETVRWLVGRVATTPEGARSLAHVLVVVPTAQSARNLRLVLARAAAEQGWGGVLPPLITMPSALLQERDARVATEAEELAVMAETLRTADLSKLKNLFPQPPSERDTAWALVTAKSLLGVLSVLGERALLMREVVCEAESQRWKELAAVETAFLDAMAKKGVTARAISRKHAVEAGCVEPGIEEILLPAAVDLQGAFVSYLEQSKAHVTLLVHADEKDADKFDDWGRPTAVLSAELTPEYVMPAPTAVAEADDIARFFRAVDPQDALPALAVCDADMYPELEGAFQNHFSGDELTLRNPSRESLATSSLGRLLTCILQLAARGDYETFSTFVRSGDVVRWAAAELGVGEAEVLSFTGALDAVQNKHLPRTVAEVIAGAQAESESAWHDDERKAAAGLKTLAEKVWEAVRDPFAFLGKIFATVTLDERNPSDRELIAAAETVRDLRAACASELIPFDMRDALFLQLLKSAAYSLEPTAPNVLATSGWLEIPWCLEDELVIAGFNEGCVPESIVGHPFVPDALRGQLGLVTNEKRALRDAFIFAEALRCRARGMVTVRLHQIASDKNVLKPSRILFGCVKDADVPALAMRLYAVTKGNASAPPKELPEAWRLKLPMPPKGTVWRDRISVTALDQYLRCPFHFFLGETFGEHADDRNQELDNLAFGTLCHAALESFAKEGPKDSTDSDEIASFLAAAVRRQLTSFGSPLPAIIELQGEAAIARLGHFAVKQATWRKAGWCIVVSEQNLKCRIKDCPTVLSGKVDRIDENERTGELAIIDYKTWSRIDDKKKNSVQLPAYRAMVESSGLFDAAKAHDAKALYCILSDCAEDTFFDTEDACHKGLQSEAENRIVTLLTGIANGIFYPPGKESTWKNDFPGLVWDVPEKGIDPAWLDDQKAREQTMRLKVGG